MIFILLEFFSQTIGLKTPAVFTYYSSRMILAALTALGINIFCGSYFIRKLQQLGVGQSIRTKANNCAKLEDLHSNKQNTPTMGGVIVLGSMLLSLILWMDWHNIFTLILFVSTIYLGAIGAYDDFIKLRNKNVRGLSGKKKLLLQSLLAAAICSYFFYPPIGEYFSGSSWFEVPSVRDPLLMETGGELAPEIPLSDYITRLYLPFIKEHVFSFGVIGSFLFMTFVVLGSSNSVNLTDGLDGLAAGCLVIVSACLALFAFLSNNSDLAEYLNILYIEGSGEIAIYLCAFAGACLGFLWYNGHPAQVFMGDTGSLGLGGVLGVSAILLRREFLLGLIGGIFVIEALSVIIQVLSFRIRQRRVFLIAPLHHHFEYKGWPETKVVMRFWIISLILAVIGIASLKFQ